MKTAMLWGATGGIGQSILAKLNADGWNTVAVARDTRQIATQANHTFDARFEDVKNIEQTVFLVSQEVEEIDLWVYAAGDILSAKVADMDPQDWDRILAANLTGAFTSTHYSLPLLSETAHLFFLGAVSERLRLPGLSAYAAAKAGLEAFATALGKEARNKHVTVVRPGAVATPLWDKIPLKIPPSAVSPEKVARKILEAYASGHKGLLNLTSGPQ